jgi:GxxExxY protein
MEVHRELGNGFLEPVYQEALVREFFLQSIPYEKEVELNILYKGFKLEKRYFADFICYDNIIVELKSVGCVNSEHESQVINYLNTTGYKLGLLINFGTKSLFYKCLVLTNSR